MKTVLAVNLITRRAIELFIEPMDVTPAEDATDEEWDAAFDAHCRKTAARKAAKLIAKTPHR